MDAPKIKEMLTKKPKYKLIEEEYNKKKDDELRAQIKKLNEDKKYMKQPMDFDEIKEFGLKVMQDRENLQETKREADNSDDKKAKIAEFYENLQKNFPKKTKRKPEGHPEDCECE